MNILQLLQDNQPIFAIDDIESKKMQTLVQNINDNFATMSQTIKDFDEFLNSQLQGENNHKIIMVKSLKLHYGDWQGITQAYDNAIKQETDQIEKYNKAKNELLNNLKTLLNEVSKEPVLSLYDLIDEEFIKTTDEHDVIILGSHNTRIIENMINTFSENLVVDGHFKEIPAKDLNANYDNVYYNVNICTQKANEMYSTKPNKLSKINETIKHMEDIGKVVVFFETYRKELENVGCSKKSMLEFEKNFTKQYIPLKKALQKGLKVTFVEICDIQVNEENFETADIENSTQMQVDKPITENINIDDIE